MSELIKCNVELDHEVFEALLIEANRLFLSPSEMLNVVITDFMKEVKKNPKLLHK